MEMPPSAMDTPSAIMHVSERELDRGNLDPDDVSCVQFLKEGGSAYVAGMDGEIVGEQVSFSKKFGYIYRYITKISSEEFSKHEDAPVYDIFWTYIIWTNDCKHLSIASVPEDFQSLISRIENKE